MYRYLKSEVGDAVSDETLRRFCEQSPGMITWLEKAGVPFECSLCPFKTSYPTDKYYIYFSGNENHTKFKAIAKPAPRGHRARGRGISGLTLFHAMEKAVRQQGVQVRCQTQVQRLVLGEDGEVIGVEGRSMRPGGVSARLHGSISWINAKANTWMPPTGRRLNRLNSMIARRRAKPYRARARKAIILTAGGFMFNRDMAALAEERLPLGHRRPLALNVAAEDGRLGHGQVPEDPQGVVAALGRREDQGVRAVEITQQGLHPDPPAFERRCNEICRLHRVLSLSAGSPS
jgi:3-oxo-5alpha-steroid 4-dehydrogenase